MPKQIAYIIVGDHLGQVKKVLQPSNEVSLLAGFAAPSSSNPVVSIEPIGKQTNKQLIANRNGELYLYNCIQDTVKPLQKADDSLNKAIPVASKKVFLIYDKQITLNDQKGEFVKQKKGQIKNAKINSNNIAFVGEDIPLRIFDIEKRAKIFEAEPPEKDWLGIQPDVYVSGLDFVGQTRVATCSKSDSVIRIYDIKSSKARPIISVDISQEAFNEHADSARFLSIASTGDIGHSIVVGSNVGQILAIDLRFNTKQLPKKKKLQPRAYKILGSFKGARGGSIKEVKIVPAVPNDSSNDGDTTSSSCSYQVISCSLDRYLRVHNFTKTSRQLERHTYMTTKPYCCSPVFLE